MKNNLQVRQTMLANEVRNGELAFLLGISSETLLRRFRQELPADEQKRLCGIITEYARTRGQRQTVTVGVME